MIFKRLLFNNLKSFSTKPNQKSPLGRGGEGSKFLNHPFFSNRTYKEELYASRRVPVFNPSTTNLAISSLNSLIKKEGIKNELISRKRFIRPVYQRGLRKWEGRQRRFNKMYRQTVNDIWYIYQSQK